MPGRRRKSLSENNPIMKEIKTEEEDVTSTSHGFICPQCNNHFMSDEQFIKHIRGNHKNMTSENFPDYIELQNSSELSKEAINLKNCDYLGNTLQCKVSKFSLL